ncbi:hypothetical protein OO013_15995 [Mangrovivirga sp. M17]|uniref:Uncharacterized protein n=1 Tax=Mangrovivirga halotolerans TaxID=2993936 RepID=A0ABT3RUP9_9BACT|nr:hypothetical protein [Mangrovivirga halotolerans]MCX2745381.1 hypothetical protein [Mangrovivirga halotolerans]
MRNLFTALTLFFIASTLIFAQNTNKLFFPETPITWLGVDYSHMKIIGDFSQFAGNGTLTERDIKDKYFKSWNNLFIRESEKYDIKGMLDKTSISNDIDMIREVNQATDPSQMVSKLVPGYTSDQITSFVQSYNWDKVDNKKGVGVLFIAEAYDKVGLAGYYWFVAVDLETGKILLKDRLIGKPGGFGIRNYWAGSFYRIIKDIDRRHYKTWIKSNS